MSFLDHYVKSHNLAPVPAKQIENIKKLEKVIEAKITENGSDFDACVKQSAPQITDLTGRLAAELKLMKPFTWRKALSALKFLYNVSFEVVQVLETMNICLVPANATPAEKEVLLTNAGRDMVCLVWEMVNPLEGKLNWIPWKKTIEKKLVRWVAGMGVSSVLHLFTKGLSSSSVQTLSVNSVIKAV